MHIGISIDNNNLIIYFYLKLSFDTTNLVLVQLANTIPRV